MNIQKEIKLSSSWTNVGLYGGSLLILFILFPLILITKGQEFHWGMILGGIVYLALVGFQIYLFVYTCNARIVGNEIILKKQFRRPKSYSFDKIGYPTSFQLKRTKYITVEMKNDDGTSDKFLILNSNSFLSFESIDAEQVLISLRNIARNN